MFWRGIYIFSLLSFIILYILDILHDDILPGLFALCTFSLFYEGRMKRVCRENVDVYKVCNVYDPLVLAFEGLNVLCFTINNVIMCVNHLFILQTHFDFWTYERWEGAIKDYKMCINVYKIVYTYLFCYGFVVLTNVEKSINS